MEWNTKLVGRIIADHIKINRIELVSISFTDMTCHIFLLSHAGKPYASQQTILCNRGKKPKLSDVISEVCAVDWFSFYPGSQEKREERCKVNQLCI